MAPLLMLVLAALISAPLVYHLLRNPGNLLKWSPGGALGSRFDLESLPAGGIDTCCCSVEVIELETCKLKEGVEDLLFLDFFFCF